MKTPLSRRTLLQGAGVGALALANTVSPTAPPARAAASLRAAFHLTPPSGWLCDPQRPVFRDGKYHLYYLHSAQNNAPGGWDHATTTDCVAFTHHGAAIPLRPNFPVWTGSVVIDTNNTAGFGAGAIVVLATQPTGGVRKYQEQYLYWSTDGGYTFTALANPVITNPNGRTASTAAEIDNAEWFRDPKIHWDASRSQWVCVIGRLRYAAFYTSTNLRDWQLHRNFDYPNHALGGIECPDLFEMIANDGTRHWVLGASMDAYGVGLPCTYAYWTGQWNGDQFIADNTDPQWLDWGWDWYGAVTWPVAEDPDRRRYAVGWMNNWKYAGQNVPTNASDGYNGQNSVVRELRMERQSWGGVTLLSKPVAALSARGTVTALANQGVTGNVVLPWSGRSYELELDVAWTAATNVGIAVGRSADGSRHTNIGKYANHVYVDRRLSDQAAFTMKPYVQAEAPIDANARSMHLRVFVDTQSVEVYVNDGYTVLSQIVHFADGDTGISLYSDGGAAQFTNIKVRDLS